MSEHDHHHDHDHSELSETQLRVRALETVLTEKGYVDPAALDLLTKELDDPLGSEFGLVVDEVTYGAELTDALYAMAERWDIEDVRMFVVSLSIQNETGGAAPGGRPQAVGGRPSATTARSPLE